MMSIMMSTQISNRYSKYPCTTLLVGVSQKRVHKLERAYGINATTLIKDKQQNSA